MLVGTNIELPPPLPQHHTIGASKRSMARSNGDETRDEEWIVQLNRDVGVTELAQDWVTKVDAQLGKLPLTRPAESKRWRNQSIYQIPQSVKDLRSTATVYEPQTVSIGPYHRGRPHLESMEEHKNRALLTFLERSKKPLSSYVEALAPAVGELRDAYDHLDATWRLDTDAFVQLMIVDGCFLLEIMRSTTTKLPMGYELNDPVFSNHGKLCFVPYLKRDMLMLENQLPLRLLYLLFVTEDAIPVSHGLSKKKQLSLMILQFFSLPHDVENIEEYDAFLHILDFYRRSMLLRLSCQNTNPKKKMLPDCFPRGIRDLKKKADAYVRSATELDEAGVRFEQSKTCNLNDISFRGGTLRLPLVIVDDTLESQYLNMIALERFHVGAGNEVTSFVFFMATLIRGAGDVALLHSCGIVQNAAGSDMAVADLFSSLARDVPIDPDSHLGKVYMNVTRYCQMPMVRLKVSFKHMLHYFNNLVGVSIVAAISLFALATIQTLYTVLGYYHSKQ